MGLTLLATLLSCSVTFFIASCNKTTGQKAAHEHDHGESHDHGETYDNGHDTKGNEPEHAHEYQCPMLCEGDKAYSEKGRCPECKMDLEELVHEHGDAGEEEDG